MNMRLTVFWVKGLGFRYDHEADGEKSDELLGAYYFWSIRRVRRFRSLAV